MGRLELPSIFTPKRNPILHRLVEDPTTDNNNSSSTGFVSVLLRRRSNGGLRSKEEEKVYSWLYALAQTDRTVAFEYVHSTELGLSFAEADRRLKEDSPNVPVELTSPSWGRLLWNAFFHPFNVILIVLAILSYITSDTLNGCIMFVLVLISVSLRFYQSPTEAATLVFSCGVQQHKGSLEAFGIFKIPS
ncbi:hypothetical protein Cgig2_007340 [Carnegiea gigantea]|uniref:Cation-transporting P-type ATPase N-terminal domain-containing protein n=1 Tax=Carnegiea gigantea TaxID=171969 RepID=A0A9Q1QRH0_9CARY|nr:hypothetical protein Cgig2_007340 [Carnegiea gigantea]